MAELIEIETERLYLRQWRPADLEPFAQLNADPQVMTYFPALLDRAASDAMAHRCQALISQHGWGFWAVEVRQSKAFIGFVGLHIPSVELPFSPCVEIGWRLASHYWGNGYATEAARSALRVGFERLGLSEVVSFTAMENRRSRRVMERLGMHDTASSFEHPAVPEGHWLRTHCLYRLSREDWQSSRESLRPGSQ